MKDGISANKKQLFQPVQVSFGNSRYYKNIGTQSSR